MAERNGNGASQSGPQSSQVKSATRTLDIIEYVVAHDRALVAQDIAKALAIPVSSLSYLLSTLVDRGYLQRDGRRYSPGPGLERLQTRSGGFGLVDRVAPLVRTLRVQLNETASFFIRTEWDVEPIATETSEQALRYAVPTGTRLPLHALASGKAILAALSDEELEHYFRESARESFTQETVTDEATLRKQIAKIREMGFARTEDEYSLGIVGLGHAAQIGGELVGAFSVAIPKVRATPETEARIATLLEQTCALLDNG